MEKKNAQKKTKQRKVNRGREGTTEITKCKKKLNYRTNLAEKS
jgi:hypothetical protein